MQEKSKFREEFLLENDEEKFLVLHNDEVNTFDYVIDTLIDVCKHNLLQAEQCTTIVHLKGKCAVKEGPLEKLRPYKDELIRKGLKATIN
jgi:ATP-dependent Clp protease adaptor protein ClpS